MANYAIFVQDSDHRPTCVVIRKGQVEQSSQSLVKEVPQFNHQDLLIDYQEQCFGTVWVDLDTTVRTYQMGMLAHDFCTVAYFHFTCLLSSGNLTSLLNMAVYSEFSHKRLSFHGYVNLPEGIHFYRYGQQVEGLGLPELGMFYHSPQVEDRSEGSVGSCVSHWKK